MNEGLKSSLTMNQNAKKEAATALNPSNKVEYKQVSNLNDYIG